MGKRVFVPDTDVVRDWTVEYEQYIQFAWPEISHLEWVHAMEESRGTAARNELTAGGREVYE